MKRRSRRILVLVVLGLFVAAMLLWPTGRSGFATPQECLDAYYTAAQEGNLAGVDRCLAQSAPRYADDPAQAERLQKLTADLKNWAVVGDPEISGDRARVVVDERRPGKRQRLTFHLERQGGSWLIAELAPPQELPEHVPYDTHVSKVPGGP